MLDGGLVGRRPYLVVGPSGTGKTTLGLQFLCAGVRNGEHTLLVTLEEPPNEVRVNHRHLAPDLEKVDVFDAIPDVMRYERAPFKDIAAVRAATPFARVPEAIRRTPELTSIEVTITALEQMLRTEVQRHAYSRIVIDSLTALQYFCMKGFDVVAGAQTFLRFLSDLRVTTILTVEAPLEDVETPERMLARGEIRLFRWELNDTTVRAIGVEKFRGSSHDSRLHPYRIGSRGLDINLAVTISRDTREIVESPEPIATGFAPSLPTHTIPSTLEVVAEELGDLTIVGADTTGMRGEVEEALIAARRGESEEAATRLARAVSLGLAIADRMPSETTPPGVEVARALHRLSSRADAIRSGQPPVRIPEPPILAARLTKLLATYTPATPPLSPAEPAGSTVTVASPVPTPAPIGPSPSSDAPAAPVTQGEPTRTAVPWTPTLPPALDTINPAPATNPPPESPVAVPTTTPAPRAPVAVRAAPPPLPRPTRYPEPPAVPRELPPVPVPAELAPGPPATLPAPTEGVSPPGSPGPDASTPVETPTSKKRKRSTAAPRKKTVPAPGMDSPSLEVEDSSTLVPTPSGPALTEALGAPSTAAAPRPKRRVVRKKKAPQVIGATPGPLPEEEAPAPSPSSTDDGGDPPSGVP
jgi:KaiC/GvpD/RAD55 family RecA-like ATPase